MCMGISVVRIIYVQPASDDYIYERACFWRSMASLRLITADYCTLLLLHQSVVWQCYVFYTPPLWVPSWPEQPTMVDSKPGYTGAVNSLFIQLISVKIWRQSKNRDYEPTTEGVLWPEKC